ncbi:MAG: cupin domain-containing protein [Candidatus Colwellbacteria bacterium]|nr:cupin domain-containing protein [Candidatus Colwellbacteria bacterium]
MNIGEYKKLANLIRDNEIYKVYDLTVLENLNVSLTELYENKSTTGHSHKETEEVYLFIEGDGLMEIDSETFKVKGGELILVPKGSCHNV